MITLTQGDNEVRIDAGELVGFKVDGYEYIHQKGSPGWGSSDTEMFPIIGPTADAGYRISTPRGEAVMDQHGLHRELEYKLLEQKKDYAAFQKTYVARNKVKNSKYPKRSTVEDLHWQYDFQVTKEFFLEQEGLRIRFTIDGEEGMPYMFGYHPAFRLTDQFKGVDTGKETISLDRIMAAGSRALEVANKESVILSDETSLALHSTGFGHFMLWTEVPNMLCIEPITFYPYAVAQRELQQGFRFLSGPAQFEFTMIPHGE